MGNSAKGGPSLMLMPAGASPGSRFMTMRLKEPLRRLPQMLMMLDMPFSLGSKRTLSYPAPGLLRKERSCCLSLLGDKWPEASAMAGHDVRSVPMGRLAQKKLTRAGIF